MARSRRLPRTSFGRHLYYGDNLEVLKKYIDSETIDLCYIDQAFNSKRSYNQIYNNIGGEDRAQAQAFITRGYGMTARRKVLQRYSLTMKPAFPRRPLTCSKDCTPVLKQGSLLAYLVSMMLRITEIHRVLKPTGSFYLHCDPTASHYLKLILDSIFVANGGDFRMKSSGIT